MTRCPYTFEQPERPGDRVFDSLMHPRQRELMLGEYPSRADCRAGFEVPPPNFNRPFVTNYQEPDMTCCNQTEEPIQTATELSVVVTETDSRNGRQIAERTTHSFLVPMPGRHYGHSRLDENTPALQVGSQVAEFLRQLGILFPLDRANFSLNVQIEKLRAELREAKQESERKIVSLTTMRDEWCNIAGAMKQDCNQWRDFANALLADIQARNFAVSKSTLALSPVPLSPKRRRATKVGKR